MNNEEFRDYIETAYSWLEQRQDELQKEYPLGQYESYWYDQEDGTLQFRTGDEVALSFSYILIGSWSKPKETFMWGWGNQTVDEARREESAQIKELAAVTACDLFDKPVFRADQEMAWEMVALAARHLEAKGLYRVPHEELHIFFALMEVRDR